MNELFRLAVGRTPEVKIHRQGAVPQSSSPPPKEQIILPMVVVAIFEGGNNPTRDDGHHFISGENNPTRGGGHHCSGKLAMRSPPAKTVQKLLKPPMKTNASPSGEKHTARYGSQARHISDMGDIDENYFVLLGGQDGFMGSTTFVDQVDLWRAGDYIRMPLRPESVERDFTTKMVLRRASKPN